MWISCPKKFQPTHLEIFFISLACFLNVHQFSGLHPLGSLLWIGHTVIQMTLPFAHSSKTVKQIIRVWLKSLSLIYSVKIWPPDFLCNEFFVKMYRFLQNYTFEICTLYKIMNIFCKYNIFTCRSLFTSNRKVDTWFHTNIQ